MENFWYRLIKIHREMAVKTERELGICCTCVRQQSLVRQKLTSSSSVTLLVVLLSSLAAFILQFNIDVCWVKRWWCCVCMFLSQVKGNSAAVRHSSNTTKSQGAKTTTWVLIRCWLYLHAHSLHRHAYTLKSLNFYPNIFSSLIFALISAKNHKDWNTYTEDAGGVQVLLYPNTAYIYMY